VKIDYTDEQELLRKTARDFLAEHAPMKLAREVMRGESARAAELWSKLARLGWMGLALPETFGGAGLGLLELSLVTEELGRVLAPVPFLPTAIVAMAIVELGDAAAHERWLPGFAAGEVPATLALSEACGDAPDGLALRAERVEDGFELSGEKLFVPDASAARLFAVVGRAGGRGERGLGVFLVPRDAPGLELTAMRSMDPLRPLHRARFVGVRVGAESLLGGDSDAWPRIERVLDGARALVCAEMVGGAERCLDAAVAYARERIQFGRPIGANQAIRHRCADMLLRVELARSVTAYAAWAASVGAPDAALAVAMAKSTVGDWYHHLAAENIQIHGGVGFTWEYDCHLYYKRARSDEIWLGDGGYHRERVARLLPV
jgi:acyl-CoA dehydrogenase